MENRNIEIGARIKDARKAKGLTQKALADLIGKSEGAISRYEKGDVEVSGHILSQIASELSVEPIYLQYGRTKEEMEAKSAAYWNDAKERLHEKYEVAQAWLDAKNMYLDGLDDADKKAVDVIVNRLREKNGGAE